MGKTSRSAVNFNRLSRDENETSLQVKQQVSQAIEAWKLEYAAEIKTLKQEIAEVKESQTFIGNQYEDLKTEYERLLIVNKKQEDEIKLFKVEAKELKSESTELAEKGVKEALKIDELEQYGRRQNLEIVGIPETDQEDTNKIVIEVAKLLNVEIAPEQISTSHRLKSKKKRNSDDDTQPSSTPIIARFVNRDIRNRLYSNRKLARDLDLKSFSVKDTQHIYINENLTHERKRLFWKAKQLAKSEGFRFFWTHNGTVLVRKSEESDILAIKSDNDLSLIK